MKTEINIDLIKKDFQLNHADNIISYNSKSRNIIHTLRDAGFKKEEIFFEDGCICAQRGRIKVSACIDGIYNDAPGYVLKASIEAGTSKKRFWLYRHGSYVPSGSVEEMLERYYNSH